MEGETVTAITGRSVRGPFTLTGSALACLLGLLVAGGHADTIVTFDPAAPSSLWQGIAVQHFTVPPGCSGTRFEFYCDTRPLPPASLPDHEIALQVYSADREHLATASVKRRGLKDRHGWVVLDGLDLPSGAYYAQMFTNSKALAPHLRARLSSGGAYRSGHAATGWKGGTPLGENQDFHTRLTFERPESPPLDLGEDAGFLVKGAKANYAIVLALDSTPSEWTAATELCDHIRRMSGAELPIVLEPDCPRQRFIAVGFNGLLPPALQPTAFGKLDDEELIIKPHGDILLLAGGAARGSLYAVYEFLRGLGVRWYAPGFTKIPAMTDIPMPAETVSYNPPIRRRTFSAGIERNAAWMARNQVSTFAHWSPIGREYGSPYAEGPDMHTVWRLVPKPVIEQHPEWTSEVDGKRTLPVNLNTWDLCYSNPEVREYFIARTIAWARDHPDIDTVWIGQNDSPMHCTCDRCQEFQEAHGGKPSAAIVQLVNELADALAANGMTDRRARTLAYGWGAEPPVGMVLRDNAAVLVCDRSQVAAWRRIASDVGAYLYGSHNDYWAPGPTLYTDAAKITHAWRDGASQINSQISGFGGTYGSDLVHLRAWLAARVMWDPSSDVQALIDDFCRGYYGPAGEAVLESIRLRHAGFTMDPRPGEKPRNPVVPDFVDPPTVRQINTLLDETYSKLSEEPYRKHLGMAWIPYLWADFWLGYEGPGRYDANSGTWSVPMTDGEIRNRYGVLAKQFMIENGVNALGERKRINPRELAVEKMGIPWPARRLESGGAEAVVVPGVGGLIATLTDTKTGFSPLKACWGGLQLRYPLFSSTEDNVNGAQVLEYELLSSEGGAARMRGTRDDCEVLKTVALADGVLNVSIKVTALKKTQLSVFSAIMLDLLEPALGIHPTVFVEKRDGTWTRREMGTETDFWWIDDDISLAGSTGRLIIASETRPEGVALTVDPEKLGRLYFWYDNKMDHYPEEAQHGMLRLFLSGSKAHKPHAEPQPAAPGEALELQYSVSLLPDARGQAR